MYRSFNGFPLTSQKISWHEEQIYRIWAFVTFILSPSSLLFSPLQITIQGCKTPSAFNISCICSFVSSFIHLIFILQLLRATEYTAWTRQPWSLFSWSLLVLKGEAEIACIMRFRRWEFGIFIWEQAVYNNMESFSIS